MANPIKRRHIAYLTALILSSAAVFFWAQNDISTAHVVVRPYEATRDYEPLVRIMTENHFWISERQEMSPQRVLTWRAPMDNPERKGEAAIDVVQSDEETAGFITYFKKSPKVGYIWMMAVDKPYRGQGLAKKLMERALSELKAQKVSYVTIFARTINEPAIRLYKKMGFLEQHRDEQHGIVELIKHF
jgi:ribosomal protein S18 acetylase RimI-like enzyme